MALQNRFLLVSVFGSLPLAGCATAASQASPERLGGVRFAIDTAETPAPARGAFKTFAGVVEFAAGRGRLDLTAVRSGPALAVNGVTIGAPLAVPGNYYLFDSTGFILVRPASRTFSGFALARASYRHGDMREEGEGFIEFSRLRADTLGDADSARLTQHGPIAIRWHLDRRVAAGPMSILARGQLGIADAPAGEASVARWFGAAAALASIPGGVAALPPDSLQVRAVVSLSPPGDTRGPVNLIVLHALSGLTTAQVDANRLVLPAGYTETPWPGFERTAGLPVLSRDAGLKWRTMPLAMGR